jgi:ArsR family transcriptional regulator, arsenate/arsenite/antimonite-responsive transcriptional repressor
LGIFAALAHETRLEVFRLLVRAGGSGMRAGAIAETIGVPAATMSFHLKELKNAGAVGCRRESRSLIYYPDFAVMAALQAFLTENCCAGAGSCVSAADQPPTTAGR